MSKTTSKINNLLEEATIPKENQQYEIPENWVWSYAGILSENIRGISYKNHQVEFLKETNNSLVLRGGNIQDGNILNQDDNVYISNDLIKKEQKLQKGDVVIVSSTGSSKLIGKAAAVDNQFVGESFGAFLTGIRPSTKIESKFFDLFYQSSNYRSMISNLASGSNINNIRREHLTNLPFPLPPLKEQKRISEKVERLLSKVEEAKQLIEEAKESFELRRAAILDKAFRGGLTEKWREDNQNNLVIIEDNQETNVLNMSASQMILPKSWKWIKLEDILMERGLFDGPFGSNLKTADYTDSGVRVIRLENIGSLTFNESKKSYISHEKYGNLMKHSVEEGDIIFASFITEKIRVCILPKLDTAAINKSDCFCIRPNASVIDKEFLLYFLSSDFSYKFLHRQIHGATRPRINLTQLKSLPVPIPSIEEQKKIVNYIKNLFSTEEEVENNLRLNDYLDKLKQSILTKAFCGELGTNDPTEESAIELLKEVLQEKLK